MNKTIVLRFICACVCAGFIMQSPAAALPWWNDHLAPSSPLSEKDDPGRESFEEDVFFRSIVTIILESGRGRPENDDAQVRLNAIYQKINAELGKSGAPLVWKNVFYAKGSDFYDFEIGANRYCVRYDGGRITKIRADALEAASPLASARVELTPADKGMLEWAEVYSDQLLAEAVREGRFFAVNDLVNIPLNDLFAGNPAQIADRFAQNIIFKDGSGRAEVVKQMAARLGDAAVVERLRRSFDELQSVVRQLKETRGVRNIGERRFVVLLDVEGVVPLMYTRTEEGRPMNILARAGKRYNSIYFSLDALDYYRRSSRDPLDSVGAVIRVENARLEDVPDFLSRREQRILDGLQEKYLLERVVAHMGLWDRAGAAFSAAIMRSKASGDSSALSKKKIEDAAKEVLGRGAHIQWHGIESAEGYDYFLFTVSGRRFFFSYDQARMRVETDFRLLEQFYGEVCSVLEMAVPDCRMRKDPGASWEDISEKLSYLYSANIERLERRGRRDIIALLEYAINIDYSNGFLDELRYLITRMREKGDVPPVFSAKPLEDKEFVVLQVIEAPAPKAGELPRIMEISALHYRGMKVLRRFHTFVRPDSAGHIQEAAAKKGIDPSALLRRGLPDSEEALDRLQQFLGDLPIVTHAGLAKRKTLNELYASQGRQPLANSVVDTMAVARKHLQVNTQEYPYDRHSLPALFEHFGFGLPRDKFLRGFRLLRLYQLLFQELAMRVKYGAGTEEGMTAPDASWAYKRLLDHFGPPERKAQLADFIRYEKEFPQKLLQVTGWETIRGIVMATDPKQGGIELIALDYDNTIARSKGWIGSDDWFRWEIRYQDQYGGEFFRHIDRINKVLTSAGFFELMEPAVADVIRMAQAKGIKVILLTARQPWPGHREFLHGALKNMGITIELDDLVLTGTASGSVDKPGGLHDYCLRAFGRVPNTLFLDDGLKYHVQMAKHQELSPGMKFLCWYNSPTSKPLDFYYVDFLNKGTKSLEKNPDDTVYAGYLLNAFGLAQEQAGDDEALNVAEKILAMLSADTVTQQVRDFMRWYIAATIGNDTELLRALLLREVRKKAPGARIMFADFFAQIREFWGDINLAEQHQRYIVTDSRLRRERDFLPILDLDNKLAGMKVVAYRTPQIRVVTVAADRKKIDKEKQSKRSDYMRRNVTRALARLADRRDRADVLRAWVSSLSPDALRMLADQVSRLEADPAAADVYKVLENFLRVFPPKKAHVIELQTFLSGLQNTREAA